MQKFVQLTLLKTAPSSVSQARNGLMADLLSGRVRHIEKPCSMPRTRSTSCEISWNSSHCLPGVVGSLPKLLVTRNNFSTT